MYILHWSKEKGQNDKQRSTKHTHKTKLDPLVVPILNFQFANKMHN
jgi:hypothetical protein